MPLLCELLLPDAPALVPVFIAPDRFAAGVIDAGGVLACGASTLLSCAAKAGKLNSRSMPFSDTTTVLFRISFTIKPGMISLFTVNVRGRLPSTATIATLSDNLPECTTPRNCTFAMLPPAKRPPNRLSAALIGGIVRSLFGEADTARGAGAVHCTSQYAIVADNAQNNKKEKTTGKRFIIECASAT